MENKKRKNVGVIIGFIILILIILGLVGFILVDKDIIKIKKNHQESKKEIKEEVKPVKKLSDKELKNILSKYGYQEVAVSTALIDQTIFGFFQEGFDINTIFAGQYSGLVTNYIQMENNGNLKNSLNDNVENDGDYIISVDEFNEVAKKLFGPDFVPNDLNGNYINKCGRYIYYPERDSYVAAAHCGGVGPYYVYYNKFDSYEINDDVLTIKVKTIYSYTELGDNDRNLYGLSPLEQNFDDSNISSLSSEEEKQAKHDLVFDKYFDKAINYDIKLKIDGDNYYLQSVKKV